MGALDIVILGYGAYRLYEISKDQGEKNSTKAAYWALGAGALGAYFGPKLYDRATNSIKSMDRSQKEEVFGSLLLGVGGAVGGYALGKNVLKSFNKAYASKEADKN